METKINLVLSLVFGCLTLSVVQGSASKKVVEFSPTVECMPEKENLSYNALDLLSVMYGSSHSDDDDTEVDEKPSQATALPVAESFVVPWLSPSTIANTKKPSSAAKTPNTLYRALMGSPHEVKPTPSGVRTIIVTSSVPAPLPTTTSSSISIGLSETFELMEDIQACEKGLKQLVSDFATHLPSPIKLGRECLDELEKEFWRSRLIQCGFRVIKYFPYRTVYMTREIRKKGSSLDIPDMDDASKAINTLDHTMSYDFIAKALLHSSTEVYEKAHSIQLADGRYQPVTVIELVYPVNVDFIDKHGRTYSCSKLCVISFGKLAVDSTPENASRFWQVFHACFQDRKMTRGRKAVKVRVEIVEHDGGSRLELVKI